MKLKFVIAIFVVLAVLGALAGVKTMQIQKLVAAGKVFTTPPETVSSAVVREEKWERLLTSIGSITAVQGVTITPEISGTVREIAFTSGATVKPGDLLVRLDVSNEEAQLRAMEAQAELARINLAREKSLRVDNMVSQSELDTAEAALKQYQASADAIRSTIEKKTIRAPFAGRLGIRLVNLGQYLEPGKPIVSLQALSPLHADFSLPQQELAKLAVGMRVRLATDAYPGRQFEGTLTAITPEVDATTRSVSLQASFDNADQALRAGMYARVDVVLPEADPVNVIPDTSVLSAPYSDSVFVLESKPAKDGGKAGLTVRQQFIRTGATRGNLIAVESGLKAGERIVSAGVFKLRNGMAVTENNTLAPKPDAAPRPTDG